MRILLQATIPYAEDDWHIGRFSLLASHLRGCGRTVDSWDRESGRDGRRHAKGRAGGRDIRTYVENAPRWLGGEDL